MATKAEKQALNILLNEIRTLNSWLNMTSFPEKDRQSLETAIQDVLSVFKMEAVNRATLPNGTVVTFCDRSTGIWHRGYIFGPGITEDGRLAYHVFQMTGESHHVDRDDVQPVE